LFAAPTLTNESRDIQMSYMSVILTVRLTKEEQGILAKRSKRAGMKKATFVRKLIRDEEIVTGADALAWSERHWGDTSLRIKPSK